MFQLQILDRIMKRKTPLDNADFEEKKRKTYSNGHSDSNSPRPQSHEKVRSVELWHIKDADPVPQPDGVSARCTVCLWPLGSPACYHGARWSPPSRSGRRDNSTIAHSNRVVPITAFILYSHLHNIKITYFYQRSTARTTYIQLKKYNYQTISTSFFLFFCEFFCY